MSNELSRSVANCQWWTKLLLRRWSQSAPLDRFGMSVRCRVAEPAISTNSIWSRMACVRFRRMHAYRDVYQKMRSSNVPRISFGAIQELVLALPTVCVAAIMDPLSRWASTWFRFLKKLVKLHNNNGEFGEFQTNQSETYSLFSQFHHQKKVLKTHVFFVIFKLFLFRSISLHIFSTHSAGRYFQGVRMQSVSMYR